MFKKTYTTAVYGKRGPCKYEGRTSSAAVYGKRGPCTYEEVLPHIHIHCCSVFTAVVLQQCMFQRLQGELSVGICTPHQIHSPFQRIERARASFSALCIHAFRKAMGANTVAPQHMQVVFAYLQPPCRMFVFCGKCLPLRRRGRNFPKYFGMCLQKNCPGRKKKKTYGVWGEKLPNYIRLLLRLLLLPYLLETLVKNTKLEFRYVSLV